MRLASKTLRLRHMPLVDMTGRLLRALRRHLCGIGGTGHAARAELRALDVVFGELRLDADGLAHPLAPPWGEVRRRVRARGVGRRGVHRPNLCSLLAPVARARDLLGGADGGAVAIVPAERA